jgi:hypothetical protein
MRLDSARELKQEIRQKLLRPLVEGRRLAAPLAFAAGAPPSERAIQRLLSIGVAPAGRQNARIAVRVQRRALLEGAEVESIRKLARNEVDVRYIGRIQKRAVPWQQRRQRPLLIGCSVGHFRITAGTLGCFVHRRGDETPLILSNNHVLANENQGRPGDVILQQGAYDGGRRPRDVIGGLSRFVALRPNQTNLVDAATATMKSGMSFRSAAIRGLGSLNGVAPPLDDTGARVAKVGRTTGLTRGRVTAFELDGVVVAYDIGNLSFDDQIEIEGAGSGPFSDGGDSGSLIVNAAGEGVALLFAGSDQGGRNGAGLTYANPLPTVLGRLGLELLI